MRLWSMLGGMGWRSGFRPRAVRLLRIYLEFLLPFGEKAYSAVIPAEAGIQWLQALKDPPFADDGK
jgi:hypothetical protein